MARHRFEIDGQGVVLLHDVGVVHFDEGVAQVFGRSELQEIVDFPDASSCEAERRRQGGVALGSFLFRSHRLHLLQEDKKE